MSLVDAMNEPSGVEGLLPSGYRLYETIPGTKNKCYYVLADTGERFFAKVHISAKSAEIEYELLKFLYDAIENKDFSKHRIFRVPKVYHYHSENNRNTLICEYVDGHTGHHLLSSSRGEAFKACAQMVQATAQIHGLVCRSFNKAVSGESFWGQFGPWTDCHARLRKLIIEEGVIVLSPAAAEEIQSLLLPYFDILFQITADFPCDYYKDANPTNWLFPKNTTSIFAVDFESARRLPFLVDLLNITEYAGDYLNDNDKQALFDLYVSERTNLEPKWVQWTQDFDPQLLRALWGIYRHQEQMLHRLRDIGRKTPNKEWHIKAFLYHLEKMRSHLSNALVCSELSYSEQEILQRNVTAIADSYETCFNKELRD